MIKIKIIFNKIKKKKKVHDGIIFFYNPEFRDKNSNLKK